MKLSDFKDEEALDVLADLVEPATNIFSNKKLLTAIKNGRNKLELSKIAIKENKKDVLQILAILSGQPVETFHCNIPSILSQITDIIGDKELLDFFASVEQIKETLSSSSASESTEEKEQ